MCFNHVWFKLDFWKPFRSNPEQYQWLQTVQDAVLDLHFYQSVWCIGSCMNIFVSWSSAGTKCGPLKTPIKDDLTVATKIWSHRLQTLLVPVCVSSCEQWTPSTKWIHSPLLFVDVALLKLHDCLAANTWCWLWRSQQKTHLCAVGSSHSV